MLRLDEAKSRNTRVRNAEDRLGITSVLRDCPNLILTFVHVVDGKCDFARPAGPVEGSTPNAKLWERSSGHDYTPLVFLQPYSFETVPSPHEDFATIGRKAKRSRPLLGTQQFL